MRSGRRARAWALSVLLVACASDGGLPPPVAPMDDPEALALVEGQTRFAADLYGRLRSEPGNLLCSPYSVHEALSLVSAGARGTSAAAFERTLHLPAARIAAWSHLRSRVRSDAAAMLRVGTRLWIDPRTAVAPDYLAHARDVHDASVRQLDLVQVGAVVADVNAWVKQATDGMIPSAIGPAAVPKDAALMVVNAVAYRGRWHYQFDRGDTKPQPFTFADGTRRDVPLMTLTTRLRYAEHSGVRALALPYRGGSTELVVLLPSSADGFAGMEASLRAETLDAWCRGGAVREVEVFLPRFRFTSVLHLRAALIAMGLEEVFDDRADLSGIGTDPRGRLFLSGVDHTAVIEVDEEGTRAAAATVVSETCSAPIDGGPLVFRCDRPFLFALRHVPTGAILFVGRFVAPPG